MNNPFKISHLLLAVVTLLTACEQQQEEPVTLDHLYDQGLSIKEIASCLNAIELGEPESADLNQNSRTLANETIRFDDGGVCAIQNAVGLPGCINGNFSNPTYPYFYTLNTAYFSVFQSLGPGGALANAGAQTYTIFRLQNPREDHMLVSFGHWWTKYRMGGNAGKTVYFDLQSIRFVYGANITFWFLKNGTWYYWSSLAPTVYNLSAHTKGISEFQIRCTSGSSNDRYVIDDIVVNNVIER